MSKNNKIYFEYALNQSQIGRYAVTIIYDGKEFSMLDFNIYTIIGESIGYKKVYL